MSGDLTDRLRALRERFVPGSEAPPTRPQAALKTVMVVDDDEENLAAVSRQLAAEYEVLACRSGEEAVRKFTTRVMPVFAVVMDIRMPGMSGTRAAKLMRNNDPFVPIIFRTGFSDEYPEDEILNQYEGTVDYVTKGQRGQDYYLQKAVKRGIKSYEALLQVHESHQRLKSYDLRLQSVVEQLIAHERNLQTAVDFQTSLLGRVGPRSGIAIASAHRFSDAMGGDFYDIVELDVHRTGILIADVCGHGIPAALLTGMLKAQVAATAALTQPAQLMKEVNARLYDLLSRTQKFITAAYAVVDTRRGEVVYASAGHNPILHVTVPARPQAQFFPSTGFPIGAVQDLEIESAAFPIAAGDSIWLYTDGLCECENDAGELYGADRLTRAILSLARDDPQQWAEAVLVACEQFRGNRPIADDMTLLAVKSLGPPAAGAQKTGQ